MPLRKRWNIILDNNGELAAGGEGDERDADTGYGEAYNVINFIIVVVYD